MHVAEPTLEIIREPERLEALTPQWLELLARSGQNVPFLSPAWTLTWWRIFGGEAGRRLRVAVLREEESLIALVPLLSRVVRYAGVLPLRRLELLCSGEPIHEEIASEYLGAIVERGAEDRAARPLARAMTSGACDTADEIVMPAMSGEDPMVPQLAEALRAEGWAAAVEPWKDAPYAVLPGSWEEYLSSLPRGRRYNIRRAERAFNAWAGAPPVLRAADDHESLAVGRDLLESLHAARWEDAGGGSLFSAPRFRGFHDQIMPQLLDDGRLELLWLEARGQAAAAAYSIVWEGKVYYYQAGRRMDLPAEVRPGLALHAQAIRRAIERGWHEYDFLGGASHYKREFARDLRPLVNLRAGRPGAREKLRKSLQRVKGLASRTRRAVRDRGVRPVSGPGAGG